MKKRPCVSHGLLLGLLIRAEGPGSSTGGAQVVRCRLAGTAVGDDLVGELLAFVQRAEAGALNGADVYEHVLAAVVGLDEAEALGRVKPLHGSHAHGVVPSQITQCQSPLTRTG